ncbi:hypothetical protein K488DRAFT_69478 [Vararia minispora EC-137]|uniref:Uncharacterized protein n=1 Tax=Vararia minispora EC-137 TaxID=1314806 RepID=A0ACB8QQK3_9AGAM|nr:hypothetical protein K488DRAFT_69478 [Vararia minispora EC-137]
MAVEFRLGDNGIPYAIEFANVSIWPRRPEQSSVPDAPRLPTRSRTLPSIRTQKPLPSLPDTPYRGGSLRRVLRRFSEPAHKPLVHEGLVESRRRSTTCSREERDEKTRASLEALAVFSMSEETLIESGGGAEEAGQPSLESSEHLDDPVQDKTDDLNIRSGGLHVTFRGDQSRPKGRDAAARLRRLTRTIADAVAAAGMIGPPKRVQGRADMYAESGPNPEKSLFRGTYGQVRSALHDAGLAVRKCDEQGFDGACRVGTLFVANRDYFDNLIFTKVVLYGS